MIQSEKIDEKLLPDSKDDLELLVDSQQKRLELLKAQGVNYQREIQLLREQNRLLKHQLYGPKSEKHIPEDGFSPKSLFESDEDPAPSENESEVTEMEVVITIPAHKRKKKGRKPLPETLQRVEVIHDLSDDEKQCECGCQMSRIGEESSEKLEMLPPQFWVERHVRYKYACKECEGVESPEPPVKLAPVPPQILPKSIATPSLLTQLFISKFEDALPFYRQEKQFSRYGIKLSRATMCRWALGVSEKLEQLSKMLCQDLLSGPLISIDETTVQVLKEPDRSCESKSYMWVFRGGPPGKTIIHFHYNPSRSSDVAAHFIGDYKGIIQTDGYSGYNFLNSRPDVVHVGCWAHARRKFIDVTKLMDKSNKKSAGKGKSGHAIKMIGELYAIERKAVDNNLNADELYQLRQREARPILDEFKNWLSDNILKVPSQHKLGEAFTYTLNQWPKLINYLKSGIVPIDNNLTENAIRPFVVGRKNWLFSDQPKGATASALFYSFIETAKANDIEPYSYFLYLLDKLPHAETEDDFKKLLPISINQEALIEFKKNYWMKYYNRD